MEDLYKVINKRVLNEFESKPIAQIQTKLNQSIQSTSSHRPNSSSSVSQRSDYKQVQKQYAASLV